MISHVVLGPQSAAEFARSRDDTFYFYVVNELFVETNSSLYPLHSARELLFDGYDDPILVEGQGVMDIPYDKFGWFYNKNGTSTDGVYDMWTGKDQISSLGRLISWNNQTALPFEETCSSLDGVSAGDLFPPSHDVDHLVKLFVGEICRPLTLHSYGRVDHLGVRSNRFSVDGATFDYSLEENRCFCPSGGCPANGVANVSACVFNSPAAISLPHFLHADPVFRSRVTGLHPDPRVHSFDMDVMPELGVPVKIQAALQINIVLTRDQRLNFTTMARDHETYYPAFYFITVSTQLREPMTHRCSPDPQNATITEDMASPMRLLQGVEGAISYIGLGIQVLSLLALIFLLYRYRKDLPCMRHRQVDETPILASIPD